MTLQALQPTAVPALLYLGWLPLYALVPAKSARTFFLLTGIVTIYLVAGPVLGTGLVLINLAGWPLVEGVARLPRCRTAGFLLALALLHLGFWASFHLPVPLGYAELPHQYRAAVYVLFSGIGLTFFRLVGYLWERCRRGAPALSFGDYLAFMLFFPQFRHGPIERAHEYTPRLLAARAGWRLQHVGHGLLRAVVGVTGLLATALALGWYGTQQRVQFDYFALIAHPERLSLGQILLLINGIAVLLYIAESCFAHIQLGVSLAFGVVGSENFDRPYLATDPRDMWRRWNLTLSHWLRDYAYIPLGGRERRQYLNILLTFVYAGILHGLTIPAYTATAGGWQLAGTRIEWRCAAWGAFTGASITLYGAARALIRRFRARAEASGHAAGAPRFRSGSVSSGGMFVVHWTGRLLTLHWFAIGALIISDPDYCGFRVLRRYAQLLVGW
jgi:alginate O-acetyltransferase complex protein AlgI